jgi:CheY-like chemotaxis protein
VKQLPGVQPWKVVALTAHAMPGDREKTLAAGFDGYIAKPIDVRSFADEVARYLSGGGGAAGASGRAGRGGPPGLRTPER